MALSIVESNNFSAYCDEYLYSEKWMNPTTERKYYSCWFLSMFGAPTALRAIWANMVKSVGGSVMIRNMNDKDALEDFDSTILATVGRDGVSWRAHGPHKLPGAYNTAHMIIYNKMLEVEHDESQNFLIISKNLEQTIEQHYQHLNYQSELPLHKSWKEYLWNLTQEQQWAVPLYGRKMAGWHCMPEYGKLNQHIREDIASGKLKTITE